MSLRFRLNLLITLVFLAILIAGAVLIIHHARQTVADETQVTAELTSNLLDLAFIQTDQESHLVRQFELMKQLKAFAIEHHLHIEIIHGKGIEPFSPSELAQYQPKAPQWFDKLVEPKSVILRQPVLIAGLPYSELIIHPDPADEISEAWEETCLLLGMLFIFFLIANILVFVIIGRALRPISLITKGLDDIEQGHYKARLQSPDSPELTKITYKFNRMAEVLEQSQQKNRYLTQQTQAIQEEERRHLARELHDEMGQSISAIKVLAISIRQDKQNEVNDKLQETASTISEISSHIYDVVKGMIKRLHPAALEELGLLAALHDLLDHWNDHHETTFCHFNTEGKMDGFSREISITVYRLIQECLTNVAKHASASDVFIKLINRPALHSDKLFMHIQQRKVLELNIKDNGKGFNQIFQNEKMSGLGLLGMRERIEALGGSFSLQTKPGNGVSIQIKLPLPCAKPSG